METAIQNLERKNSELSELLRKSQLRVEHLERESVELRFNHASNIMNKFRLNGIAVISIDQSYEQLRAAFENNSDTNSTTINSDFIYRDLIYLELEDLPVEFKDFFKEHFGKALCYNLEKSDAGENKVDYFGDGIISNDNIRANALSMLICEMLRGNISDKKNADLSAYVYMAGVALHNIPFYLSCGNLPDNIFTKINELDPSGSSYRWGNWCIELAECFDQKLPELSSCIESNAVISNKSGKNLLSLLWGKIVKRN